MKARPLSDPRINGRSNFGIISIINFFYYLGHFRLGCKDLYPAQDSVDKDKQVFLSYGLCLTLVKSDSQSSPGAIPSLCCPHGHKFFLSFTRVRVKQESEISVYLPMSRQPNMMGDDF